MGRFVYVAYDGAGSRHEGDLSAFNKESAKAKLKNQGLIPVKIKEVEDAKNKSTGFSLFKPRPKLSDLEFLTSQLSLLLRNGVRIDRALYIAKTGIKNASLAGIIEDIYGEVRRGVPFSACLEKYHDIFDLLYINLVRIGEVTGELARIFDNLAANLRFRQKIITDTRQAMIYPLVIFSVCVLAVFFIFNFIVPRFSTIFSAMVNIPGYTKIFLTISALFRKYQYFLFPAIIGVVLVGRNYRKNDYLKKLVDVMVLRIPVIRGLFYKLENLRFASSLAVLLESRVVLSEALDHSVRLVGNTYIRKKLLVVKKEVREGKSLSEAISKTGLLAVEFNALIEVGEETGGLAAVFKEIEGRLRTQYEVMVTDIITLIEPIMIIVMGLIVGSLVVVMLLSIVSVSDISF
ncbi:MAG TPA: type II secretion system F family protein [Deltaproteobacteria bacterium]|nr:type II secretion system F family protein [Deltaproteobacteria bacterium]